MCYLTKPWLLALLIVLLPLGVTCDTASSSYRSSSSSSSSRWAGFETCDSGKTHDCSVLLQKIVNVDNGLNQLPASENVELPTASEPKFRDFEARFNAGLQQLVVAHQFQTSDPVVVTAMDTAYAEYLAAWSQQLVQAGLHQQIVLALDDHVVDIAAGEGFPALSISGDPVHQTSLIARGAPREMPKDFSILKFMVPYLLLQQAFDIVLFSEADVVIFGSPLAALLPHPERESSFIAAMPKYATRGDLNIGFMIYKGASSMQLLEQFSHSWFEQHRADLIRVRDEEEFNAMLRNYPRIEIVHLPRPQFAEMPTEVTDETIVAHLAWTTPTCKHRFLKQLYNHALHASALHASIAALNRKNDWGCWMD